MKLRSLAVNQFKKFARPTRLDGIGDGLNVVLGPNEMGKSTLFDALRAVLFEKYSSKAQTILVLQNDRNEAAPVVEMTFELGDGLYTITKRFIKRGYARLSFPDGRQLEGDNAENELRRLLNFDEPGKTGAKAETLGMWDVLWVQQGQSFVDIKLPDSARSTLHSAVESGVGAVLGGRRGRDLPQAIERQLDQLVMRNGNPKGNYKKLIDDINVRKRDLEAPRRNRQELSEDFDKLAKAQEDLTRLSDSARDETLQRDLIVARNRHTQRAELEAKIRAANSDLELSKYTLEQAVQDEEERRSLKDSITTEEEALEAGRERREEVDRELKEVGSQRDQLRAEVREAEAAVKGADDSVSRSQRILEAVNRNAEIRDLQTQCHKAAEAEKRLSEAQQKAAAILVTDDVMKRIQWAARERDAAASKLSAAATLITFDIPPDLLRGIEIDGEQLAAERRSLRAVEATTIAIPGRGRITIEPAIRDRDKLLHQEREAKTNLQEELTRAGAANVNDAEEQCAKRQQQLQEAELARQEIELYAPAIGEREAGAQGLADYIEGQQQILVREMAEIDLPELSSRQNAEDAVREAQERAATTRRALDTRRAMLTGPEERLGELQTECGTVHARYEVGSERLEKLRQNLKAAEEEYPDQQLRDRLEEAQAKVSEQETIASGLHAQLAGETLPQLGARIEQLEQAIEERRNKRENLEKEIKGLSSRIEALEGAGLDEAIEQNQRELEIYKKERARYEREVKVLTLLLSTLRAAEREAKERHLPPVLNRVRPYLQILFPGADAAIDENLHITGMVREAGFEEAFNHLSMGTQEQIAVLVRLAFAEILVEQGRPATVILDDALVFSDDPRMSQMFDILNMAAKKVQVIVLSCRERLFQELGGRQLALKPGNTEELTSA